MKMKFIVQNLGVSIFFKVFLIIAIISQTFGSKTDYYRSNKALFIFGDSFLDAGNNNYINTTTFDQANFLPYGETYFNFPTGRFSDGRLISDFIAEYVNIPLVPPFLQPDNNKYYNGVNFASGGAGALVETFQGSVIPFKTQAINFKKVTTWLRHKLGSSDSKTLLSNAVYMFSIGSNDYLSPFLTNSDVLKHYSHTEYVAMVIGNFTSTIKEIHKRGAKKFVILNLPPLGCLPGTRIIQSQGKGFKEGKSACCGSGPFRGEYSCGGKRGEKHFELCDKPNESVFWDSYHLTESAYKQLAAQMWSPTGNSHTIGSYTIRDFFQAM
ncbi:GDSL esterase/lipase 5 isoform X2 [Medicago truncatula]|uniref:GDSL-like lipase/acylhydrolase n=1 Tax=Medicago truncatula TaxID=3880 RepID=A0A072TM73_MEDTR|nr:GDSL esterase/lipase 5 isoform X2 [Medicago truncatula]KEH18512.1 GDSL-like lipase/acylhydrolase [Medicago truncatula]